VRAFALGLALALLSPAAAGAAPCAIEIRDFHGGSAVHARLALPDLSFALRFVHSVTRRPVESRYVVRSGEIVQVAEIFDEHGPGLSSAEAGAGERWERLVTKEGARFVLHMNRAIPRLVLRAQPVAQQVLVAKGGEIALARWSPTALELRPACGAPHTRGPHE
jgi:hypothetical protein